MDFQQFIIVLILTQDLLIQKYVVKAVPVDGEWGEWRPWTCSFTCGAGIDTRTRLCDNPAPANGGNNCTGPSSETRSCFQPPCPPVDGEWGEWRPWTCSVTCGTGIDMRTRLCDNPAPANSGMDCTGPSSETRVCVLPTCRCGGKHRRRRRRRRRRH